MGQKRSNIDGAKLQGLAQRLVLQLHMVLRTLRIHDPGNRALLVATENLKDSINTLWAAVEGPVRLQFVEGEVYANDVRLRFEPGLRDQVRSLEQELLQRELGGLAFARPVDSAGLRDFLIAFGRSAPTDEGAADLRTALLEMRDLAVELLDPARFEAAEEAGELRIDKKTFALQTYAKSIVAVREFVDSLKEGRDADNRLRITRIVMDLVDIATERVNFLLRLSAIKQADNYDFNHATNTCILSIILGRALEVDRLALVDLGTSAILADVGFALLPPELIRTERKLSDAERHDVRDAMARQIRALIGTGQLTDAMMRRVIVAYEHHLPFTHPESGKQGYTHLFSRIVQVADAFDALTTRRPWREGYTADEALRILVQDAGERYDPLIVKMLVNLLGMHPLGSAVRLGTGEVGVVYHNPSDPEHFGQPWVRLVRDEHGQPILRTVIRNLANVEGPAGQIVANVRPRELEGLDPGIAIIL